MEEDIVSEVDPVDVDSWDINQPETYGRIFQDAIERAGQGADDAYRAELLTQIARTEGLRGNFAEAHAVLDRANSLISPEMKRARIKYLLERGRALNSAGDAEAAIPLFRDAWDLAESSNEEYLALDAAHMLGIADEPAGQLKWSLVAIERAEKSSDARTQKWLGPLYNNVGWTYHDLGEYDIALEYFEKSYAFRRERNQPNEARIASWTVGRALRSLGRYQAALELQESNRRAAEEAGQPGGYISEEIAECLLALGKPTEAKPYFSRAFAVLSQDPWLAQNEPDRLRRLAQLGDVSATDTDASERTHRTGTSDCN
jgi:tetratricopeptide (TPR) repeat protein